MSIFPGAIASFTGFTSSHTLLADGHASQHNSEQAEIVAVQTKVGTGSSTSSSGTVLRGSGAGTSAWGQIVLTTDVTGVLPIANGGTAVTVTTGTAGKLVYDTGPTISAAQLTSSPTLTTPIIASFANATHNHQNAAGGGTLGSNAITGIDKSVTTTDSNPYKFRVSQNAAANTGNAAFVVVPFDTEQYDTNNNVLAGVYTAPVNGFYQFNWNVTVNGTGGATEYIASLFKAGVRTSDGGHISIIASTTGLKGSDLVQLTAGDTVDIRSYNGGGAVALIVGTIYDTYFSGFLVCRT